MEISVTRRDRFAFGWIEGLGILANPLDWSLDGWVEFCELLAGHGDSVHHYPVGLNYAPGRGPNAEELKIWREYLPRARLHRIRRMALVSDLDGTRHAQADAQSLMPAQFDWRPFAMGQLDDAFAWLNELSPFDLAGARRLLAALRAIAYPPA
jgi:hypothetical protein